MTHLIWSDGYLIKKPSRNICSFVANTRSVDFLTNLEGTVIEMKIR